MPVVDVSMLAGREPEVVRGLIARLHDAVVEALDVPPEIVKVLVREVPPEHWGSGGVTIAERRAAADG